MEMNEINGCLGRLRGRLGLIYAPVVNLCGLKIIVVLGQWQSEEVRRSRQAPRWVP